MKKTIKLVSILLLVMMVVVSCSPEKTMDGKTAETKKQMTSTEYSENRGAIQSVSVLEAYAIANSEASNSEAATSITRGLSEDGLVFTFNGIEDIIKELEEKAKNASNKTEEAFYLSLAKSLPSDLKVSVLKDSFVKYKETDGVKVVSSLDISIVIDGKTIEIEKDVDDKWIEIDGTFFDDTELEKMLDAAEDAAEAIEEFFNNLSQIKIDFDTLISGDAQSFKIEVKDGTELEAIIEGSTAFKITDDKKLSTSFDFKYTEYEDDGKTVVEEFNIKASLKLNLNPTVIGEINLKDIADVSVTINGMEVWADAFLDELD